MRVKSSCTLSVSCNVPSLEEFDVGEIDSLFGLVVSVQQEQNEDERDTKMREGMVESDEERWTGQACRIAQQGSLVFLFLPTF